MSNNNADNDFASDQPAQDFEPGGSFADESSQAESVETPPNETFEIEPANEPGFEMPPEIRWVLQKLASLKLTVVLFGLSLILVMVGTLAQAVPGNDIWDVVNKYFRCWVTWVDAQSIHKLFQGFEEHFDSRKWSPRVGIWFPGGFTIGVGMAINLLAAHALKFKVQAKGVRQTAGWIVLGLGALSTWIVIESGHTERGEALTASITWDNLWIGLKSLAVILTGVAGYGLFKMIDEGKSHEARLMAIGVALLIGLSAWLLFFSGGRFDNPSMRILWNLAKCTAAAVVLLVGCILLFKKRAGVVLLHGGVMLVMANEVVVHLLHVETRMTMFEGDTVNYAEDIRESEFVLVDSSDPETEEVVSFSSAHLERAVETKETLSHPDLPFDIKVLSFFKNSDVDKTRATNRVTAGVGTQIGIVEAEAVAGTDTEGVIDINSAIVQLIDKKSGQDAGVLVISVWFSVMDVEGHNTVTDSTGKTWDVQLRNKRYYKPYSVTLIDTSRRDYVGTSQVQDYRSLIRIYDPVDNVDITQNVWMNNPLRFSGETFYQSDHRFVNGKERSVLSVVQNSGWLIPYLCCVIVGVGMLAHFWVVLTRFLNRLKPATETEQFQSTFATLFPWAMAIIIAMYFYSKSRVPSSDDVAPDLFRFGQIPIIYEGRDQPLDSLARNSMRVFCKRDTFSFIDPETDEKTKIPAIQWMYDLMTDPQKAEIHRIFRIDNPQLLEKLGLPDKRKSHCFAKSEFKRELLAELYNQDLKQALDTNPKRRDAYARAVVGFFNKLRHYENMRAALDQTKLSELAPDLFQRMEESRRLQSSELPRIIPPDESLPEFKGDWIVMPLISTANEARIRFGQEPMPTARDLFFTLQLGSASQQARRSAYQIEELIAKERAPRRNESLTEEFEVVRLILGDSLMKLDSRSKTAADDAKEYLADIETALKEVKDVEVDDALKQAISSLATAGKDDKIAIAQEALASQRSQFDDAGVLVSAREALIQLLEQVAEIEGQTVPSQLQELVDDTTKSISRRQALTSIDAIAEMFERLDQSSEVKAARIKVKQMKGRLHAAIALARLENAVHRFSTNREFASLKEQLAVVSDGLKAASEKIKRSGKFNEGMKELMEEQATSIHQIGDMTQKMSNNFLEAYMQSLERQKPADLNLTKTNFESFYNNFAPFWWATWAYIFAFVLSATALLVWQRPLNQAAFYVILVTLLLHTFSLVARIYISGRPPVTNLYASAVFIGWGTVIFGLIYESIYKLGIGNLLSSILGAATLGISAQLMNDGDTFKVLVAVLDTQFWLATHVTCITLGYSTTFVAGVLGVLYVLSNAFNRSDERRNKEVSRMIYGTVAFGIFFSFVGTVLGGLWADDSWGRFWGWDPKENGALMIVLWNALVLHARWDRLIADRGLAVLAIGGNIVTSWSWFGVNELGVGLHSYGFTEGVWRNLWIFWTSQVVLIIVGVFVPMLYKSSRGSESTA